MSGELLYARFSANETRIYGRPQSRGTARILVYDLSGDIRAPTLRDRLSSLDVNGSYEHVLLRGVSDFLRADIEDGEGKRELVDRFGAAARLWLVDVTDRPALVPIRAEVPAAGANQVDAETILAQCAQIETEAALVWCNAIWSGPAVHFVAPSGYHTDKFIRVGDAFADPINISRVADWCSYRASPPTVLVTDSFTLLPLLQEIELRWLSARGTRLPKFLLPVYGTPEDVLRERLSEMVPLARDSNSRVLVLVSVTASGGYVRALTNGLTFFEQPPVFEYLSICKIGDEVSDLTAICRLAATQFASREACKLCIDGASKPIEIDQQHFTTRLGVRLLETPKIAELEEANLIIADADRHGAFRVHVNRAERHGHLAIFMDTARLLESRVFGARMTIGLARALRGFRPDIVLVPRHEFTSALQNWLANENVAPAIEISLDEPLRDEVRRGIGGAERILLCDDAVVTGRTMHAMLEIVQREKGRSADSSYQLRGFTLVARPAWAAAWKGLGERFFIDNQRRLFAGWEINLPDVNANGRDVCPWCIEARMLRTVLPRLGEAARPYIERRIARLSDPEGLSGQIYLAAELAAPVDGWDPAVHTTPSSYLGDVSDVGAYVACSALLQRMRDAWETSSERWSTRYAIPLHKLLRRFTDPVIASAFLRGIQGHETMAAELREELERTLSELDHASQDIVLVAELLLAGKQKKLPYRQVRRDYSPRLENSTNEIFSALRGLFGDSNED